MRKTIVDALERRPDAPRDQLAREYFSMGYQMLVRARRYDESARFLKQAVEAQAAFDPESWNVVKFRLFLGEALLRGKHYEEAEPVLRRAFDEAVARISKAPAWEKHFPNTAAGFLADLCAATGRPDEAKTWKAERARHPARETPPKPAPGRS
ncbi:MAG: tetratricopeptide repeat protein [Isosphaeraceae bacterium]